MRLQRREEDTTDAGGPETTKVAQTGVDLAQLRETVGGLLDAGNAAIERALSEDSESFLRASRQQGGK